MINFEALPVDEIPTWSFFFCLDSERVRSLVLSLLFTHIYSPWLIRISVICLIHLNGPSAGGAEMVILRSWKTSKDTCLLHSSPELPGAIQYKQLTCFCQIRAALLSPAWGQLLQSHKISNSISHGVFVCKQDLDFCRGQGVGVEAWVDYIPWLDWI